jgi:hypothetical protein
MATATTGTLTRNTEPHQKCSRSHPPITGPRMMPNPATPAHTPMARPRSRAGNTLVMMERVEGMIRAPPIPMAAREAISTLAEPAKAEATEPATNTSRPMFRASFRPNRSPRAPMVRRSPANTST